MVPGDPQCEFGGEGVGEAVERLHLGTWVLEEGLELSDEPLEVEVS